MSFLKSFHMAKALKPKPLPILVDFPWLWAIRQCWSWRYHSDEVRVSQDLNELRLVLTAQSSKTPYIVSINGFIYAGATEVVSRVPRLEDASWCRAIMARFVHEYDIKIIAVHYEGDHNRHPIVLYRHPEKSDLSEFIEQTAAALGIRSDWRLRLDF